MEEGNIFIIYFYSRCPSANKPPFFLPQGQSFFSAFIFISDSHITIEGLFYFEDAVRKVLIDNIDFIFSLRILPYKGRPVFLSCSFAIVQVMACKGCVSI